MRIKHDTAVRTRLSGVVGLLPDPADADSVRLHRAWVALQELARCSVHVATSLRELDVHDAYLLSTVAPSATSRQCETALALLHGLRLRLGRDDDAAQRLSVDHAVGLLEACLQQIGRAHV